MLRKDHIIFKEFYVGKYGAIKTIRVYFKKWRKEIFDLIHKSVFWSIETLSENQNIMTYWILMHRGNGSPKTWLLLDICFIHQYARYSNQISLYETHKWKCWALFGIYCNSDALSIYFTRVWFMPCRKWFCCKILTLVD